MPTPVKRGCRRGCGTRYLSRESIEREPHYDERHSPGLLQLCRSWLEESPGILGLPDEQQRSGHVIRLNQCVRPERGAGEDAERLHARRLCHLQFFSIKGH